MKKITLLFAIFITIISIETAYGQLPFITTWQTTTANEQITIPVQGAAYDYDVDWGDGTVETGFVGNASHTYTDAGTHTVTISGDFRNIYFNFGGDKDKILTVEQWGDIQWSSMQRAFAGCTNIVFNAPDIPNLTQATSMQRCFTSCTNFNSDIGNWDTSNITDMWNLFHSAPAFNQDIGSWDVSKVTKMQSMFQGATSFNQDISNWNTESLEIANYMFAGATSFNQDISDWDMSSATNINSMFDGASSFNQDIGGWNVSNATRMDDMFLDATSFNQDLSNWNIANVTHMPQMFNNSGLDKINYDKILQGWAAQSVQPNVTLGASGLHYCNGSAAHDILTGGPNNWIIDDAGLDCLPFITTWKTDNAGSSNNDQITIPATTTLSPNFDVDWGDGNTDTGITGPITHTYAAIGTYTVSITGDFTGVSFNGGGDKDKLLSIEQWGDIDTWRTLGFRGCSDLQINAVDAPNLSTVNNLSSAFRDCYSLNSDIGHWNTSTILSMQSMFQGASSFNQDISSWDVNNVTNMREMFRSASSFDQDLNNWDVSKVTNMFYMFAFASNFNGQIGNWDVGMVSEMSNMFNGTAFNQPIGNWDVTSVSSFLSMFANSAFNQDIGSWDVSGPKTFNGMFSNTPFNQDIGSWDLTSALGLASMFEGATNFNQDLSSWSFPNVTSIGQLFDGATSFNQDLSAWDVSNVSFMFNIFDNTNLSKDNYDNILTAWSQQSLQSNVELGALGVEYCLGGTARQSMIDTYSWTFVGDTENCIVNIPDSNFKAALLANGTINTIDDGEITIQEASVVNNLQMASQGISDLTGIEAFTDLTILNVFGNILTSIDLSNNVNIHTLNVTGNTGIQELDLSPLTNLVILRASLLGISAIDFSNNPLLENIEIKGTSVSSFDFSNNPNMEVINADNNQLTSVDISSNPQLTLLWLESNQIETIDISGNPLINSFDLDNNALVSLNVANANNANFVKFEVNNNPQLTCITVDDPAYSKANWTNVDDSNLFKLSCDPNEIINIPDAVLKGILTSDPSIDTNEDDEIQVSEAEAFTGNINAISAGVADATGLEYFINAKVFDFRGIQNTISTINVTNNTALIGLWMSSQNLTTIDVSKNPNLTTLFLGGNNLSSIDVSNNPELTRLLLEGNNLSDVDLSNNLKIQQLSLGDNNFTSIDVSFLPELNGFYAENSPNLTELTLGGYTIDPNKSFPFFTITGSPNLTCVSIDNVGYAINNLTNVDDPAIFKLSCDPNAIVNIPDANFKAALLADANINTTNDGEITYGEAEAYTGIINVEDLGINELTGIEAFLNLTELDANRNNLTSIDLSNNTKLTHLFIWSNDIETVDLSYNTSITNLNLNANPLGSLDVSMLPDLFTLQASSCGLANLDVSSNPDLQFLLINNNELTGLDVTNNPLIHTINISDNSISTIDVSSNTVMKSLNTRRNGMTSVDVSNNTQLTSLYLHDNEISTVDVSMLADLQTLFLSNNMLTALDVSNNAALQWLSPFGNDISELDLSTNTALTKLEISSTNISTIDVSANVLLEEFTMSNTPIAELDFSTNDALTKMLALNNTELSTINLGNGNNNIITSFNATGSSNLACITVDDVAYAEANFTDIDEGASFSTNCNNKETDMLTFSFAEQTAGASIDATAHTVAIEVAFGTDRTSLAPTFTVSVGASVDQASGAVQDFSAPFTYTITAENPNAVQEWVVTVLEENVAPTDLSISDTSIDENNEINDAIGSLSTTDANADDSHSYSLVAGEGDTDNASFDVSGGDLIALESFDFETKDSYSVRVQTDDGRGGTFSKAISISIGNIPSEITAIELSANTINENEPVQTVIGNLSTSGSDLSGSYAYSLVAGEGDTDNASFDISEGQLINLAAFNFEAQESFEVRIKSDDGTVTFEQAFTITILDVAEAPTDITIEGGEIAENNAIGDVVGAFAATDEDANETYTFSLAEGDGSNDNTSFTVTNEGELVANEIFDFETRTSYSIRVEVNDGNGGSFQKQFTIEIADVSEAPTDLMLSATTIEENNSMNDVIGTFSTIDPDAGETHAYSLVVGEGNSDNASFQIVENELQASEVFDFESKTTYSIRVETNDGNGGTLEEIFEITVTDVNEGIVVVNMLDDQNFDQGFASFEININGVFEDEDGDELTFEVASSDQNVVTAVISNSAMVITEVGNGSAILTLTASDGNGESASDEFTVTVEDPNDAPVVASPLVDLTLDDGFGSSQISLADVFSDPNNDNLTINAESSNSSVVTVSIANDQLTITEVGLGTSTITVTADDGNGATVSDEFTVTVNEVEAVLGFEDQLNIQVYPNPVINILEIESVESIHAKLMDLNGKLLSHQNGYNISFDMQNEKQGVYLLIIEQGSKQITRRVIKAN